MNFHRSIYSDGVDSALRTIAAAEVGKETVVFEQCCRDGMAAALSGGMDKADVADRSHNAGEALGFNSDFIQDCLASAVRSVEAGSAFAEIKAKTPLMRTGLEVVCMADVRPSAIDWLWPNWIALGKVHVLAGEGGRGKSTILCNATAITTTGTRWPDGAVASRPGSVIILTAEDDVEDTLAPRLMAAGADLSRVFVIRSVFDENKRRGFSLQADLERLETEIGRHDNVSLVIIDPISSYLGKVDSHKNADVRSVLEPLGEMAARLRVAIICNNHFSKGGGSANSRVIGSVAFVNQARAAFIVTPDEDDDTRMLLIPSKMNIAPIRHGLAYRIRGVSDRIRGEGDRHLAHDVRKRPDHHHGRPGAGGHGGQWAGQDGQGGSDRLSAGHLGRRSATRQAGEGGGRRGGHIGEVAPERSGGPWHQTGEVRLRGRLGMGSPKVPSGGGRCP